MALETINSPFDTDLRVISSGWTKRKRSRRSLPFHPLSEDEHIALCLIMLTCGHEADHEKVSFGGSGSASAEDDRGDSGISSASLARRKGRSHECSVCGRTFASGQALGGHKRSHFDRNGGKRARRAVGVSVCETSGRRCRDFDLNLLPPAEAEEEDEVVESPHPHLFKKARLSDEAA